MIWGSRKVLLKKVNLYFFEKQEKVKSHHFLSNFVQSIFKKELLTSFGQLSHVFKKINMDYLSYCPKTKQSLAGDFAKEVKQIKSQSDVIWMSSFHGPSYLTVRSSTISDKLDATTCVENLTKVHFISRTNNKNTFRSVTA